MTRTSLLAAALSAAGLWWSPPAAAQGGTVTGVVQLAGAAPAARWLKVTKNKEVCGDSVRARDLVVKNQKVAYAVVEVAGVAGPSRAQGRLLSNTGCQFGPPVMAASVGDTLLVDNKDDVLHNTHLNFRYGARVRTVGNWGLSQKGMSVRSDRALRQAGVIDVECDAHPWMASAIYVFNHPYYAVTDEAGSFTIANVPAGTHKLTLHHPVFGEMEASVTVTAGGTASAVFSVPAQKLVRKETR